MTNVFPLLLTTAQDIALDETCSMQLWYSRYHNHSGLISQAHIMQDEMLEATLNDMRTIAQMEDISQAAIQAMIDEILSALTPADHKDIPSKELLYRRLGWMAAYALYVEPENRKTFDIIDIPDQVTLKHDNLRIVVPTGRLFRHKLSKQVEHHAFVPASVESMRWREMWEWNITPHMLLRALRDTLDTQVNWCRIQGLATGFTASKWPNQLHHPYVYAQYNTATREWSHQFKFHDQDGGFWVERPVWEYDGTLTQWIVACGKDLAERQFPRSLNIPLNTRFLQDYLIGRNYRERQIATHRHSGQTNPTLRQMHFPRRTSNCTPLYTSPCRFKDLCWSEKFMAEALEQTRYKPRLTASPPIVLPPPTLSERIESAIEQGRASVVEFLPLHQPLALPPAPAGSTVNNSTSKAEVF